MYQQNLNRQKQQQRAVQNAPQSPGLLAKAGTDIGNFAKGTYNALSSPIRGGVDVATGEFQNAFNHPQAALKSAGAAQRALNTAKQTAQVFPRIGVRGSRYTSR